MCVTISWVRVDDDCDAVETTSEPPYVEDLYVGDVESGLQGEEAMVVLVGQRKIFPPQHLQRRMKLILSTHSFYYEQLNKVSRTPSFSPDDRLELIDS